MMFRVVYHPDVSYDLKEAYNWYEEKQAVVFRFLCK